MSRPTPHHKPPNPAHIGVHTVKILVTGGAGYIGSVTTGELIRAGHEAAALENPYQGHRAAVHPQAVFVQGDLAIRN